MGEAIMLALRSSRGRWPLRDRRGAHVRPRLARHMDCRIRAYPSSDALSKAVWKR